MQYELTEGTYAASITENAFVQRMLIICMETACEKLEATE